MGVLRMKWASIRSGMMLTSRFCLLHSWAGLF